MTTKLEQAEAIITKVEQMRKWQKEYFAHRDALALRKAKELEKEIDYMITSYRGENLLINIIGDDPNQTTLDLLTTPKAHSKDVASQRHAAAGGRVGKTNTTD